MMSFYKPKSWVISIIFLSVLLFTLVILLSQVRNTRFMLALFPPADLYSDLVKTEIRLDGGVANYDFAFTPKYVGTYLYGVRLSKMPPPGAPLHTPTNVLLSIEANGNVISSKQSMKYRDRFGSNDANSAVIWGYFNVPGDISMNKQVIFHLNINRIYPAFRDNYGKATFYVSRATDY